MRKLVTHSSNFWEVPPAIATPVPDQLWHTVVVEQKAPKPAELVIVDSSTMQLNMQVDHSFQKEEHVLLEYT